MSLLYVVSEISHIIFYYQLIYGRLLLSVGFSFYSALLFVSQLSTNFPISLPFSFRNNEHLNLNWKCRSPEEKRVKVFQKCQAQPWVYTQKEWKISTADGKSLRRKTHQQQMKMKFFLLFSLLKWNEKKERLKTQEEVVGFLANIVKNDRGVWGWRRQMCSCWKNW